VDLHIGPAKPLPENLFLAREALRAKLERRLIQAVDVVVLRDKPRAFVRRARAEGQQP